MRMKREVNWRPRRQLNSCICIFAVKKASLTKTTNSAIGRHMVDYSPQDVESRSGRHQRRALSARRLRNTTLTGECTSARFEPPGEFVAWPPANFVSRAPFEKSSLFDRVKTRRRTAFKYLDARTYQILLISY